MKTIQKNNGFVIIEAEEGYFLANENGPEPDSPIRRACVPADSVGQWSERPLSELPPYTEAEYAAKVSELIHRRYSVDDEIALLANSQCPALLADEDAAEAFRQEYADYQSYRARCKAEAREALAGGGKETAE